jgi:hypothetical protein
MKTPALPLRLRPFATLAIWLAVCIAGRVSAAFVYETTGEFLTSGDFNGDGLPDVLVLNQTTGSARVGYGDGNGHLTWSAPLVTGVNNVSGIAVGHFKTTTHDALVVTAASLNRVQLYDLSGTNASLSLGSSTQSGLGPHSLASLAAPFGSPPPFGTLLIASSLNDPPPERLDIVTNFPIGSASSAGQFPETGSFVEANALPIFTNGPTFAVGMVRGATNDALHLWQFTNSPAMFLALSNLAPGSDYVFGNFNGEPLPRFIIFQPGGTNLTVYPLLQTNLGWSFGPALSVLASEPVRQVFYLALGSNGTAVLLYADGAQGLELPGGAPVFSAKYTAGLGAAGNTFTGIAPLANGQFALLDAPGGSVASAHEQVVQFDGVTFTQRSATNLPSLSTRSTRANVWLFQLEPFVYRNAGFIASVSAPDWSDSVSGLPAALSAVTEADAGTNAGLGNAASSSLGAPPTGATNGLPNQYNPAISVFSYSAPQAAEPVSILISPPPGSYGGPITISLTWPGTGSEAFYRISPPGTWQSYTAPFLLTNDATIQYYGQPLTSPSRSQMQFASYTVGNLLTTGSNSPIATVPGDTNTVAVLSTNQLTVSQDGTVFYGRVSATNNYTIWAINLDGSSDTYVTTGARPRVSRDGKYLAFLRGGSPLVTQGNAYVRNLATGQEFLLYSNTSYTISYDWDLTETNLIFDWSCWLWTIAVGSSTASILPLPAPDCFDDAPAVNPADDSVAFQNLSPNSGISGLYVTSPARTSKTRLNLGVVGASWPAWSPDGNWLAFVDGNSSNSAYSADAGTNLWVARRNGTSLSQLSGFYDGTNRFPHGAIWMPGDAGLVAAGTIFGTNGLWILPLTPDLMGCDGPPIRLPTSPGDAIDFAGSVVVAPPTSLAVATHAPGLFIRQTADAVVVYWSTNYAGYSLASTLNLATPGWLQIAGPYFLSGGYYEYWESRATLQTAKFFRLQFTGAVVLSQTPLLTLQLEDQFAALSWPDTVSGFTLETTTNLDLPVSWWPVTNPGVVDTNGQMEFLQPINQQIPSQYFRLRSP